MNVGKITLYLTTVLIKYISKFNQSHCYITSKTKSIITSNIFVSWILNSTITELDVNYSIEWQLKYKQMHKEKHMSFLLKKEIHFWNISRIKYEQQQLGKINVWITKRSLSLLLYISEYDTNVSFNTILTQIYIFKNWLICVFL